MPIKYQVNGDIFLEITEKWPFAYVKECLIRAREYRMDSAGNKKEYLQLSDGRVFARSAAGMLLTSSAQDARTQITVPRLAVSRIREQSATRPR
jgi:hypothetical protein